MKPSERMLSLGETNLREIKESLRHNLLDLLIDGPSSFAALYGGLVRHCGYSTGLDVFIVADALLSMEHMMWVKAWQMADDGSFHEPTDDERKNNLPIYQKWLPRAKFEELSLDEIGLWYEIKDEGRAEWRRWTGDKEREEPWVIDDLRDTETIIIQAETEGIADRALAWWLSHNPEINLVNGSESVELIPDFRLHDGTVISNGIKLVWQYHIKENN